MLDLSMRVAVAVLYTREVMRHYNLKTAEQTTAIETLFEATKKRDLLASPECLLPLRLTK